MANTFIDTTFKSNVLFNYGSQGLSALAGLVYVTLVTRYAGLETYGMMALLGSLGLMLSNLVTFRTNEAVTTFCKQSDTEGNQELGKFALCFGLMVDLFAGLLAFILVYASAEKIALVFLKSQELAPYVQLYASIILAIFLRGAMSGYLTFRENFKTINSLVFVEHIIKILILAYFIIGTVELTIKEVMYSVLVSSWTLSLGYVLATIFLIIRTYRGVQLRLDYTRQYLLFSGNTFLSSTLKSGRQNLDRVVLAYFTSPTVVGIYELLQQFLNPLGILKSPFSSQSLPMFIEAINRKETRKLKTSIQDGTNWLVKPILCMSLATFIIIAAYFYWNNIKLDTAVVLSYWILVANHFVVSRLWWSRPFSLALNPTISLKANLLATVTVAPLMILLTPPFTIIGVSLALLLSNLIISFYWGLKLSDLD